MFIPSINQQLLSLCPREWAVLLQLSTLSTSVEIAEKLGLLPKSVNTYNQRIAEKLGFEHTHELIRFAVKNVVQITDI